MVLLQKCQLAQNRTTNSTQTAATLEVVAAAKGSLADASGSVGCWVNVPMTDYYCLHTQNMKTSSLSQVHSDEQLELRGHTVSARFCIHDDDYFA